MKRFGKCKDLREMYIARGEWYSFWKLPTRSKHGRRLRRVANDARWWNRVERRAVR